MNRTIKTTAAEQRILDAIDGDSVYYGPAGQISEVFARQISREPTRISMMRKGLIKVQHDSFCSAYYVRVTS